MDLKLASAMMIAVCMGSAALLTSCSEPQDSGVDPPAGGGSGETGGTGTATGGTQTSSGAGGGESTPSGELVGSFQVQVTVNHAEPATGATSVIGKVNDAPSPSPLVWTVVQEEGVCRLETPRAPFCNEGCGAGVCVEDATCVAYPTGKSVGEVTLAGAVLAMGGESLVLKEVAKSYQPPPGSTFSYPPFTEGAPVTIHATGSEYPGFDLAAKGVAPLTFTSTDFALDEDKALELTWTAATDPNASRVHLKLNISNHGGTRGVILCNGDDDGELTVPATLITELIGLGVAGFPTVVLVRETGGDAQIPAGRVQLVVSSKVEQFVTVAGVDSCTEDADCPGGMTCQPNLTCQ